MCASAACVAAALIFAFTPTGRASSFLRPHAAEESEEEAQFRIVQALLNEFTRKDDEAALQALQDELRPLYTTLPKDAQGELAPPTVRYALHRHFAQWRGWQMKGLERGARELNTTAVGVAEIFGRGQGVDLRKLALLVSKLTSVVDREAEASLRHIFAAQGLPTSGEGTTTRKETELALRKYLVMYLLGDSTEDVSAEALVTAERDVVDLYPAWRGAKMWFRDLEQTLEYTEHTRRNPFIHGGTPFEHSLAAVQELGHRFASFQNLECNSLKNALMDIEHKGTGRVLLSDFYRVGLTEDWQFNEKIEYLRSLGALDENEQSVFIPNYLHSPTNCLSASGFYAVCCFNECEGLMTQLERRIAAPSARPEQLATLVAALESDTVAAPRNLSATLEARLGTIAKLHGGQVPLHGRLFAQWMHHAYPRECPFPHVSGSTQPLSQEEWQRRRGADPVATKEEMARHSSVAPSSVASPHLASEEEELAALPWTEVEELVAPLPQAQLSTSFSPLRLVALLLVLLSAAAPVWRAGGSTPLDAGGEGKLQQRCLV